MSLSIGIDLQDVADIESALARFGEDYLARVFTSAEIDACGPGIDVRRLAACFAAKEASRKALAVDDEALGWRAVEVLLTDRGAAQVELTGGAAELAAQRGVVSIVVSTSIGRTHASAIALAELRRPSARERET